jgi:hypothetical protein
LIGTEARAAILNGIVDDVARVLRTGVFARVPVPEVASLTMAFVFIGTEALALAHNGMGDRVTRVRGAGIHARLADFLPEEI